MQNYFMLFIILLLLTKCNSKNKPTIIGSWELIEIQASKRAYINHFIWLLKKILNINLKKKIVN